MRIKERPEDFIVEEITPEGLVLEIGMRGDRIKGSGEHLICCLEKKNWDTILAIKKIAKRLGISKKRIGFAGTKDKKAWTTQRISIWNISPETVQKLRIKDIRIIPLEFSDKRVELGDLWGNRFTIKVYSDTPPKNVGEFPNYFGEQRFGSKRRITDLVGEAIIQRDFQKAAWLYLTHTGKHENSEVKEARERLKKEQDFKSALKYFPKYLKHERTMLAHLSKYPNDYVNAFRKLPKNMLIMFAHSFQARLFNEFLDEMIKRGLKYKYGPLFGYEYKITNELEKDILEKHGLKLDDFKIREFPEMSSKGEKRRCFAKIYDFQILEKGEGWYRLRFSLEKGCYATVAVKYIFKEKIES